MVNCREVKRRPITFLQGRGKAGQLGKRIPAEKNCASGAIEQLLSINPGPVFDFKRIIAQTRQKTHAQHIGGKKIIFGAALRDIPKTAAEETKAGIERTTFMKLKGHEITYLNICTNYCQ